jgi:hypothetical protein
MTSIALPKSAVNFEWGREVPHILYTKVARTARRILVIGENRLLQHNRGQSRQEAGRPFRIFMSTRPSQANNYFFLVMVLNETPNRIETLRIRSGVRFMIRAASSSDTFALASSMTRRSSANDQDLAIRRALL